jgi:uncharacterized damage-inducible protein DinB
MDMQSPLADAFGHHVWATVQVLDACAVLGDEQLALPVPGTYGSIIDTLRHLVGADVFYLDVMTGNPEPFDEPTSDIATLRKVMQAHDEAWQRLVGEQGDPATVVVEYEDSGWETLAPLGIRLAQALHHGTDHRSQVCTALTALGVRPPLIDLWDYGALDSRVVTRRSARAATPS